MGRLIGKPRINKGKCGAGPILLRGWRTCQDPIVTQTEVAQALGYPKRKGALVGHRSVQDYEVGKRRLPTAALPQLEQYTGIAAERFAWPDQVSELRAMLKAAKEA